MMSIPTPPMRIARRGSGRTTRAALLLAAVLWAPALAGQSTSSRVPPPRVTTLGTCRLAGDVLIADCRVAYRTYGRLSAARDNVVLIPTFFGGRSEDHLFMLGAYVDTTRHHVIIVDALADGYSSSPSNTTVAAGQFAAITIGDMVDVQHRLLTDHLGIDHVRAVVGISMGGFQAFEWAVRYPAFMDAVVPIVGSPRPTTYDRLIYDTWRGSAEAFDKASVDAETAWMQSSRLEALFMRTPRFVNDSSQFALARSVNENAAYYRNGAWSFADYATQLRAIAAHDISARFGGDMKRTAAAVDARMLVVWSPDDHLVDHRPAAAFARLARADTLVVQSSCGHAVFWCEPDRIGRVVRAFVARAPALAVKAPVNRSTAPIGRSR